MYASRVHLIKEDAPEGVSAAIRRHIVSAQTFYALAAALCFVSTTYVSIAALVIVQMFYVIAPRFSRLSRAEP